MPKALYECNTDKQRIAAMQKLINSGSCWKMEGAIGREAMAMINNGDCILGKVAHFDYWGNKVPSRYEVKSGTKGSIAYRKITRERCLHG